MHLKTQLCCSHFDHCINPSNTTALATLPAFEVDFTFEILIIMHESAE
jgi:hypothetical protein